jgi:predicted ATPase
MISNQFVQRISLKRDKIARFDGYPFCLPAVKGLNDLDLHPKVTFLIGENGTGKSTLLEAIALSLGFNAEGGTKNFRFSTCASHSELYQYLRISKGIRRPKNGFFLRAESFFNVATEIENLDKEPGAPPIIESYGGRSLHEQSHGESFLALMMNRFSGNGIYLLDEPEAALSPQRQLAVLSRMHDLILGQSQFIIATHSPILMAYPEAIIYCFSEAGIQQIDYFDTEHYQVMHNFLAHPKRMLDELLRP